MPLSAGERRGLRALPILALAAAAIVAARAPDVANGALEGERLVLRDAGGNVYAEISRGANGAVFELRDAGERPRIRMTVAPDGTPRATLADAEGRDRVELSLLDEATPRVLLRDAALRERAKVLLMPDGSPMLYFKDAAGTNRLELTTFAGRFTAFVVFGEDGKPRGIFGTLPDGRHALSWLDAEGAQRLTLGVTADGAPIADGLPE